MAREPTGGSLEVEKETQRPGKASEGLAGVTIADSEISLVDGKTGRLLYRGYDINDLAEHSTFEETAYLLLNGKLPTRGQLDTFQAELGAQRALGPDLMRVLEIVAKKSSPISVLRTAVSVLGNLDPQAEEGTPEARRAVATRLLAKFPTIVAAHQRMAEGKAPVEPLKDKSAAFNFLRMLRGKDPTEEEARAIDVALILHADHEFNASTFAARVTTSTLSDVYSAVATAVGTLKGPLHGGANREVMKALETIKGVKDVDRFVSEKLAAHEKVMGFGHRVYKTMDPRARILKKWSKKLGEKAGDTSWYEMSARMEELVLEKKGLYPNVDFYAASVYQSLGIPRPIFPALFALSRISGWLAHVLEQYDSNKLIRPLANYTGPTDAKYAAIEKRT